MFHRISIPPRALICHGLFCVYSLFYHIPSLIFVNQVANEIMNWGTSAVFQLKRVAQMKGHTERLRVELGAVEKDDSPVKIDNPMYKDVVQGAVGDVFLKLNSPGMGKLSKKTQE